MVLVSDSSVQLSPELISAHNIKIVEYPVYLNGETYPVSMNMSREEKDTLRLLLKDKSNNVTTSGLKEEDLKRTFVECRGEKIIFTHQAGRASTATTQAVHKVLKEIEADIEEFDTGNLTAAHTVLVYAAAQGIKAGMDFDALMSMLKKHRSNTNHLGAVYDLFYLHRTGRISLAKAVFGTALKIIPLLGSTDEPGVLKSIGKAKTYAQANQRMITLMEEDLRKKGSTKITGIISVIGPHEEEAKHLKKMIDDKGWDATIEIYYTNHSNMPHAGPDFYDIGYYSE